MYATTVQQQVRLEISKDISSNTMDKATVTHDDSRPIIGACQTLLQAMHDAGPEHNDLVALLTNYLNTSQTKSKPMAPVAPRFARAAELVLGPSSPVHTSTTTSTTPPVNSSQPHSETLYVYDPYQQKYKPIKKGAEERDRISSPVASTTTNTTRQSTPLVHPRDGKDRLTMAEDRCQKLAKHSLTFKLVSEEDDVLELFYEQVCLLCTLYNIPIVPSSAFTKGMRSVCPTNVPSDERDIYARTLFYRLMDGKAIPDDGSCPIAHNIVTACVMHKKDGYYLLTQLMRRIKAVFETSEPFSIDVHVLPTLAECNNDVYQLAVKYMSYINRMTFVLKVVDYFRRHQLKSNKQNSTG